MDYPKISVMTPSFNQGDYLETTIQSVLNQDYPNLEYIIIDGGSSDHSLEIIKKYEKHLTYWTSEKDKGLYDGVQKGFAKSSGEIMCWINSDDIFHPKSLFVVAEVFSKMKEVEWLQGTPSVIDDAGRVVYVKNFRQWSKYDYFLGDKDHIQQESTFWRRSLWEKAGSRMETSLKLAGDYELWMRFFNHSKLYCIRTILGAFRMRSKNQMSLERMGEYNTEVASILGDRIIDLTDKEKAAIELIQNFRNPATGIFAKKIKQEEYNAAMDYAPAISFNREKQSFVLEK